MPNDRSIKFGTDGWRGIIADDFTFDNVRRVAGGIAAYLLRHEDPTHGVFVGYDTRFLSRQAARVAADMLTEAGIPVRLAKDSVPTPAVSLAVKAQSGAGGVMITSSHNPWNWNGVKFKAKFGGSATPAIMKVIEEEVAAGSVPKGQKAPIEELDLTTPYSEAICQFADLDLIAKADFKFAVDSMHGSGRALLTGIFDRRGVHYVAIRQELNPLFPGINPEPIEPHIEMLRQTVLRRTAMPGWPPMATRIASGRSPKTAVSWIRTNASRFFCVGCWSARSGPAMWCAPSTPPAWWIASRPSTDAN